jgi:hypothetical protein
MNRDNLFHYVILAVIILLAVSNVFKTCSIEKKQQEIFDFQLAQNDSLQKQIKAKITVRVDTTKVITERIHETIKFIEKKKDEINQINDLDSLVANFYRLMPDSTQDR